jgi:nucleoside-diphosphate-sugar epimerase
MKETLNISVTGANGYLGSRITEYFRRNNYTVYKMTRSLMGSNGKYVIPFSLGNDVDPNVFKDIEILIHCAWDFRAMDWETIRKVNVEGSLRLFEAAKKGGVDKIIFISTMSAFDGCKSLYGKAKLEVEKRCGEFNAVIVRPGLLYDNESAGMIGALEKLISLSPIIPIVGGDKVLYLCHTEDLSKLIAELCISDIDILKPIIAASEKGLTFKQILKRLAASNYKKPAFIPIPSWIAFIGLKAAEQFGLKTRVKSDSLLGLIYTDPQPDFSETKKINIRFRSFN